MSSYYKQRGEKRFIYGIFGFVAFLQIVIVMYALFMLVISGPDAQVNMFSFVGGTYYVPAAVYFFACTLVSAFCFGYFCHYIAGDLKTTDADKAVEKLREDIKGVERRLRDDFEKKFGKISMDQFLITENLKHVETKIAKYHEKIEKRIGELPDKKTLQGVKKKTEELKTIPELQLAISPNMEKTVEADRKKLTQPKPQKHNS